MASTPGFVPSLLQIAMMSGASDNVEATAIRQASSVYLKNFVDKHWETYEESVSSLINDADKATIRTSIIEAVVAASEPIRVQLLQVVRRLVRSDFPKVWTTALNEIVPLVQSGDVNKITAGLLCLLEVVEFRGGSNKEVNDVVQGQIFPILLQLGQQFIQHIEEPAAQNILKTILKCYFTAIQFKFTPWLMSGEAFMSWSQLSLQIIQAPVPAGIMALDREDAPENKFWKMKKWAFHIQNKIMSRYGNNKLDTFMNSENPEFAKAYMSTMAVPILQVYLAQIQASAEGRNPLTDRIICIVCDFLEHALRHKKTWEAMKAQVMWIVQSFVFPRLCWTEADAELWQDDPHEFIRTKLDPFDDFYSPSASCINFVVDLIKNRRKDTFVPILGFINGVLTDAQSSAADLKTQSLKDGALYMVGSMATVLLDSKRMSSQMEGFLASFVLPELQSPVAHLRLRACWVVEQFDELQYKTEANAVAALSGVLNCMNDAEFPVKVASCTALAALLENPVVAHSIPPYLPRIVETILTLANEIELDSLSYVLEDIVTQFAEEMAPWAAQLCAQLRDTLMRSIEQYNPDAQGEEGETPGLFDDTDKMMAVLGMLGTITTLVETMNGKKETMAQLETILLPMIYTILTRKIMDVYEEAFALLDSLTYGQKIISPAMWQLLEPIYQVFVDAGSSYIADMATTIDNYISYGNEQLVASPQALHMIVEMIRITMTDGDYVESDWVHGCNLMESLMLNCRGKIDQLVPHFIQLTMNRLADKVDSEGKTMIGVHASSHRVYHIEVILNALYYSPVLAIQELERNNATGAFLAKFIESAEKFIRVHDKKLIITAVSALLSANIAVDHLPAEWQNNWAAILPIYLDAVSTLPKAMEERKKLKEEAERSDNEDDGISRGRGGAEDSDDDYEDGASDAEAYTGRPNGSDFENYEGSDWDDESDWEDADELEEEIYLETPLDQIDVGSIVTSSIKTAVASQPTSFQRMITSLNPAQQATLQSIMQQH